MSSLPQAVIFDLDGTLLDTLTDLANSANHVLTQLGLPTHSREAFRYFVGNGIEKLVQRILPDDRQDLHARTLQLLRHHYSEHWADTTAPYPGITSLLDSLSSKNIPFAVLSNKPEELTRANIHHYFSQWSFHTVAGASADYPKKPDGQRALTIAAEMGCKPENIFFVGDSSVDMQTAHNANMRPIGVLWGFRTASELQEAGAEALISKPIELLDVHLSSRTHLNWADHPALNRPS